MVQHIILHWNNIFSNSLQYLVFHVHFYLGFSCMYSWKYLYNTKTIKNNPTAFISRLTQYKVTLKWVYMFMYIKISKAKSEKHNSYWFFLFFEIIWTTQFSCLYLFTNSALKCASVTFKYFYLFKNQSSHHHSHCRWQILYM